MIEKIAQDIELLTNIKLAALDEFLEKLAAGNITNGAQLMQHIGTQPMTMLGNLMNAMKSGKMNNNLPALQKFHGMYMKNPSLQQAGNRMGFTNFFNNFMSQATQAAKPSMNTGALQSMKNQQLRSAIQKSRVGAATNGIPNFGAFYA